jgi:hypothetical protein
MSMDGTQGLIAPAFEEAPNFEKTDKFLLRVPQTATTRMKSLHF